MKPHFCKVGKIRPNLNKIISLKEIEKIISNFVEDVNKVEYSQDLNATF